MADPRQSVPTFALEYKRRPADRETRKCERRADNTLRTHEEDEQ